MLNMDICSDIYALLRKNLQNILSLRSSGRLKEDNTFVSDGDFLCQKLIFDYLTSHLRDYVVFSEESVNSLDGIAEKEFVVTVDPIDGTENFISGLKEWGVGVSIYRKGTHYQSMIALPELDILLRSGDTIGKIKGSRICGLSSYMKPQDFLQLDSKKEYRIMGCCMYNMYNVIKGSYSEFCHLKGCYSWDILPGLNLALENKLYVEVDGEEYRGQFLVPNVRYKFRISNV